MTETSPQPRPRRVGRAVRAVLQAAGFVVGIGLLGWCVRAALSPDNRDQLARLGEASAGEIALMLGLSLATLVINGLLFWAGLRPVRRVPITDHLATNALCSFLAFLPFKLGAVVRVAINTRRDGVPLLMVGAWYGAMCAVLAATFGPASVASLLRHRVDGAWLAITLGGCSLACGATVLAARAFAGERGASRLRALARGVPGAGTLLSASRASQALAGFDMLAHAPSVAIGAMLRLADLAVNAARFAAAAAIVGHPLAWDQAILAAIAYYMLGIIAPTGMLGAREAGTVWFVGAVGLGTVAGQSAQEAAASLTVLTLFITGTESVVLLAGAAGGVAWLRPDRLLRRTPPGA